MYQIRLLDRNGRERVRVDRRPDGVVLASPAELQDKSDRYYFREAIVRPAGSLYISPGAGLMNFLSALHLSGFGAKVLRGTPAVFMCPGVPACPAPA